MDFEEVVFVYGKGVSVFGDRGNHTGYIRREHANRSGNGGGHRQVDRSRASLTNRVGHPGSVAPFDPDV